MFLPPHAPLQGLKACKFALVAVLCASMAYLLDPVDRCSLGSCRGRRGHSACKPARKLLRMITPCYLIRPVLKKMMTRSTTQRLPLWVPVGLHQAKTAFFQPWSSQRDVRSCILAAELEGF